MAAPAIGRRRHHGEERAMSSVAERAAAIRWTDAERGMLEAGFARLPALLTAPECTELRELYADDRRFRSRVDMARHRFGLGEYRYFDHPLPPVVDALRSSLYPPLAGIANRWGALLGASPRFPDGLEDFLALCHQHGQRRPTPLLLRYESGGYNTLHQDVYGEVTFPLQVVIGLSAPGDDYTGGELLVVEQRPRAQARATAITLAQGEGVLLATREKPAAGARGHHRTMLRHGVSTVTSGTRSTLGIIFHDAT
jgi:hypothetical protein